ncbi:MAG TPA: exodeoxyribonuclease III [Pseudomonadales bacterium]|jgi:exodeoxyribonuclease-3
MMRVISFCADGIRKAAKAGFYSWVLEQDADVICIQNLRSREDQLTHPVFYPEGYHAYFLDSAEGHNGVAIYCRELPKAVMTGLGMGADDAEARYIQADFEHLSIASVLPPAAASLHSEAFEKRMVFLEQLQANLDKVRNKRRNYIICGNFGIAHKNRDIEHPEGADELPGGSEEERLWLDQLVGPLEYLDAFRCANSDDDEFSWQREIGTHAGGWRTDLQIISANLEPSVEYAMIYKKQSFSTHAPVIIDYDTDVAPSLDRP